MIIEKQAEGVNVEHKVEICCSHCGHDISMQELEAKVCGVCNGDLSTPKQNVAVTVNSVTLCGESF